MLNWKSFLVNTICNGEAYAGVWNIWLHLDTRRESRRRTELQTMWHNGYWVRSTPHYFLVKQTGMSLPLVMKCPLALLVNIAIYSEHPTWPLAPHTTLGEHALQYSRILGRNRMVGRPNHSYYILLVYSFSHLMEAFLQKRLGRLDPGIVVQCNEKRS